MINASAAFASEIQADSRTFRARLFCNGQEIECDIRRISIKKGSCGDGDFTIGAVYSSLVEITASGITAALLNKEITIKIGLMVYRDTERVWDAVLSTSEMAAINSLLNLSESTSGWTYNDVTSAEMATINSLLSLSESTSNWDSDVTYKEYTELCDDLDVIYEYEDINVGRFVVLKAPKTTREATISAAGFISTKMDVPLPVLSTQTIAAVASAITRATGITIRFDGTPSSAEITQSLLGLSCKRALDIITFLYGGYATENTAGEIEIRTFEVSASPVSADGSRMLKAPERAENAFEMSGVRVDVSDETEDETGETVPAVSYQTGTVRQTYTNEYMTEQIFEAFASNVVGYSFVPATVDLSLGDPRIEPWDGLTVTDNDGDEYFVPCHGIVHTFDGGLSTQIVAAAESETETDAPVAGAISQQLNDLSVRLLSAEEAIIKKILTGEIRSDMGVIGGFHIADNGLFTEGAVVVFDCIVTTTEQNALKRLLGMSGNTTDWTYSDLTQSEMTVLNDMLDLSEDTSSWDASISFSEYQTLCDALDITEDSDVSVYIGSQDGMIYCTEIHPDRLFYSDWSRESYLESAKTVASGSRTAVCSISLPPGRWLCNCGVRFPSNASGRRMANLAASSGSSIIDVQTPAVDGDVTQLSFSKIVDLSSNENNVSMYLNAYQDSGSALQMPTGSSQQGNYIFATRIG